MLLAIGILIFLLLLIGGVVGTLDHKTYVIGGKYIVHENEIVRGNLELIFAQATVEKGSRIEGGISSFSSSIDIFESVAGEISSIESDIKVEQSAELKNLPEDKDVFPFVVLLPKMARWNLSIGRQ